MILTSILYSSGVAALLNHLKRHRLNARLSQGGLAARAGVSRQAYAAVESGKSAPSTELALRLSRALATQVDLLFSLADEPPPAMQAELMEVPEDYPAGASPGPRRARIWRVGGRLLARPVWGPSVAPQSLLDTEGVILSPPQDRRRVAVQPFDDEALEVPALAVLGCDPAVALLESGLRGYGVRLVAVEGGSRQALTGLARGDVHVAGCHLKDETTGEYNHSWVSRLVPFPCTLITFAAWRQGLMVRAGNPKGINAVGDLARPPERPPVVIVNRETGSGSRSLLDRLLNGQGIPAERVAGYDREAAGHLAVARTVASGAVDAGIGVQAAAWAMGLDFVLLEEERYDLVVPNHLLDEPPVQALFDLLRRPGLHRRVEALGGYDAADMGMPASRTSPAPALACGPGPLPTPGFESSGND